MGRAIGHTFLTGLMTGFFWVIPYCLRMGQIGLLVYCPPTNDTHGILLSQYLAAPAIRMIFYADGSDNLVFFSSSMGLPNPSFSLIDHSSWSHITMNSKNNKVSIFENMIIRLEDLSIDPILSTQTRIGNDTISTRWLKGSVDDVRIYSALSADEIQLLYEEEAELPEQSVTSAKLSRC